MSFTMWDYPVASHSKRRNILRMFYTKNTVFCKFYFRFYIIKLYTANPEYRKFRALMSISKISSVCSNFDALHSNAEHIILAI